MREGVSNGGRNRKRMRCVKQGRGMRRKTRTNSKGEKERQLIKRDWILQHNTKNGRERKLRRRKRRKWKRKGEGKEIQDERDGMGEQRRGEKRRQQKIRE